MKRYIEIVYDNSGSMNSLVGKKRKYEIAQELFEKDIIPKIGLRGDQIVLRLLGNGCKESISIAETLPNQRNLMIERIKQIKHEQSTPLFYTVSDSIEACRNIKADEYIIFVLTDGDDTCNVKIDDIIDTDTYNKYVKYYNVLLVQLAVDSAISRNNLTAFTNALGGQSLSLNSSDSISEMRTKLKNALNISGFTKKLPLEHCFDNLPGFDKTWDEIEDLGINFHQAMLLHQKGLLTWSPDLNGTFKSLQVAELQFVFSLFFKSAIPEDLMKTMLSQLKKPYYYSFDCIYWDFGSSRWKYFVQQNKIVQLENPDALNEDNNSINSNNINKPLEKYDTTQVYKVEITNSNAPTFILKPKGQTDWNKTLKNGDLVRFE